MSPDVTGIQAAADAALFRAAFPSDRLAMSRRQLPPLSYTLAVSDAETQFLDHSRRLPELVSLNLSEADTRAHVVDPVLRLLGYTAVSDIRREVPIPRRRSFSTTSFWSPVSLRCWSKRRL